MDYGVAWLRVLFATINVGTYNFLLAGDAYRCRSGFYRGEVDVTGLDPEAVHRE
jgi:hypothetical protein